MDVEAEAYAVTSEYRFVARHFRRLWAGRHEQVGESTLIHREGDVTDRNAIRRQSLRMCIGMMKQSRSRIVDINTNV